MAHEAPGSPVLELVAGPSYCFTDLAGTIPAGEGDFIRSWRDRISSVLFIATTDSLRPTLEKEANRWYVRFTPAPAQHLTANSIPELDAAVGGTVGIAIRSGHQTVNNATPFRFGSNTTVDCFLGINISGSASSGIWRAFVGAEGVLSLAGDSTQWYNRGPHPADVRLVGACTPGGSGVRLSVNGNVEGTVARPEGMPATVGVCEIGDGFAEWHGRVYGLIAYTTDIIDTLGSELDDYLLSLTNIPDYPSQANVKLGVEYDYGELTGSLAVPLPDVDEDTEHSPADIIRRLIIQLGLGSPPTTDPSQSGAWPVYAGKEPNIPDNCITVRDTQGKSFGRLQHSGEFCEDQGFQVRVRARDHPTGFTKTQNIAEAFDTTVYQDTVSIGEASYLVHMISRTSDVIPLGSENPQSQREIFTVNGVATILVL